MKKIDICAFLLLCMLILALVLTFIKLPSAPSHLWRVASLISVRGKAIEAKEDITVYFKNCILDQVERGEPYSKLTIRQGQKITIGTGGFYVE